MEGTIRQALRAFGLTCKTIRKDKSAFVCGTERGPVTVERVNDPLPRVLFRHRVKSILSDGGFTATDAYRVTEDGLPYAFVDGEAYTAANWHGHAEANLADARTLRRVLSEAARMHALLRHVNEADMPAAPVTPPAAAYERDAAALRRCKKLIHKNRPFSDFDVAFLRQYDFYERLLADWRALAESAGAEEAARLAAAQGHICHGALKEEHVLVSPRAVCFINFRDALCAPQRNDAAELIARHWRGGGGLSFDEAAKAYADGESADLAARLLYPDRFLRLCEKYYEKKRTWIPGTFAARLESVIQSDAARREILRGYIKP